MKRANIEPGLLGLFRWFVAIRLVLLLFLQLAGQERAEGDPLFVPVPGIIILGLLLAYLLARCHRANCRELDCGCSSPGGGRFRQ
jgi:hypothetical protein